MKTYEKVYGLKRICVFTSRSYTNIKSVSPSFRHKMRSGRVAALLPSAAIRRIDSGRVTRSWPILSHVRLFGFGKHRALSLELEPSRERSAKPQLKNAIFGSKLSFLGVHYIVLQYILIASFASRGNCVRKAFLHLHFSVWSMFDYPALSFAALQLYGMVWHLSMQLQITVAPSFLKLRNKFEFSCWKIWMSSHSDMLHAFHSLPSVWVANHHHGPMLLPWLSSSRRKIAKPDLQVQVCRCARDEPGLTKAMERRTRICIAAKRSQ